MRMDQDGIEQLDEDDVPIRIGVGLASAQILAASAEPIGAVRQAGLPAASGRVAAPVKAGTTLTKAELAEMLFDQVGLNKREAKDMVETFFDEISAALVRGESVKLSGFGNFDLRSKNQRPGRNPKTGEEIPISARRVVTFRPGQKLKARVEAYAGTQQ